jgi:hypothetical protein
LTAGFGEYGRGNSSSTISKEEFENTITDLSPNHILPKSKSSNTDLSKAIIQEAASVKEEDDKK